MSDKIASFLNGSMLVIRIGNVQLAYCQSLSFNQNMTLTPVGGVGAYNNHALEPVMFTAGGTMRVVRWTTEDWKDRTAGGTSTKTVPENLQGNSGILDTTTFTSGNGIIDKLHFDPLNLLLSSTFDIHVHGRQDASSNTISAKPLYSLIDCRLTGYSFSFQPGSLLFEDMSFVCLQVQENDVDNTVEITNIAAAAK
jgi:hypothetical protein